MRSSKTQRDTFFPARQVYLDWLSERVVPGWRKSHPVQQLDNGRPSDLPACPSNNGPNDRKYPRANPRERDDYQQQLYDRQGFDHRLPPERLGA